MNNISSKTKTVLFASLIAALILPLGMNSAFAEIPEDIKAKALEGKQIWEKLEKMKEKLSTNASEVAQEKALEKKFESIVKLMNKHGIATQEQWDADPQYWRSLNLPPSLESSRDYTHSTGQIELQSGNLLETTSHGCGSCTQPQELHVIAGFDYLLWGFWPTSAYSEQGWKVLTYTGQERTTLVTTQDDHDEILPHITQKIKKAGTVNYDYLYDARVYGTMLDSGSGSLSAIQVDPSSIAITFDELLYVPKTTTVAFEVEVTSMQ